MSGFQPLLEVNKLAYVDTVRSSKGRIMGMCKSVKNLMPTGEGMRLRSGYSTYSGVTVPDSRTLKCHKSVPIQSPDITDIHVQFTVDGSSNQYVYMNPYYIGATKTSATIQLDENTPISSATGSIGTNTITVTNAVSLSLSQTNDYYNGWVIKNTTQTEYALITDYSYSAGTSVFTILEDIDAGGLNWAIGNTYIMYRSFHGGLQSTAVGMMTPAFSSNAITYPPSVIADNNILYVCGGHGYQSHTKYGGYRPIYINPHLKRTFFDATSRPFTYEGTYIEREELLPIDYVGQSANAITWRSATGQGLPGGATYWLAYAFVYDGYQLGELQKYETLASYQSISGSTYNYVSQTDANNYYPIFPLYISGATLNKRCTGIAFYIATDYNVQATERTAPYQFIEYSPFTSSYWRWDATTQSYKYSTDGYYGVSGNKFRTLGNSYQLDRGTNTTPADDTMSYCLRTVVGGRHFIANTFLASTQAVDFQNVYTNPVGTNENFNLGKAQRSIFTSDGGMNPLQVEPTIGTKINALTPIRGSGDTLFVGKDFGTFLCQVIPVTENDIDLATRIINATDGVASPNGYCTDVDGSIYYAGFNDIYNYRLGNERKLIERKDGYDWLSYYRSTLVANDKKNACLVFDENENKVIFCFGNHRAYSDSTGFDGMQFAYFPLFEGEPCAWQQIEFAKTTKSIENFQYISKLSDKTIVGMVNCQTPYVMQLAPATMTDNTNAIVPYVDTGSFSPALSKGVNGESNDFVFAKFVVNKNFTTLGGTLNATVYGDGTAIETKTGLSITNNRLPIYSMAGNPKLCNKIQLIYNSHSSPEIIASGTLYQIHSIELWGDITPRHQHTTDL